MIRFLRIVICLAAVCISISAQSKSADKKTDAFVREQMAAKFIPGLSLVVLKNGKIVYSKGYGMANRELSVPVTDKTSFPIYSITKTFTAVAIMMLAEEGKLSLDDPVSKHLPAISRAGSSITVRNLLNHTSGIIDYVDRPLLPDENPRDEDTFPSYESWLTRFTLESAPGEKWMYQNTGYYLLGRIIEKASGKAYGQFLHDRIFTKLKMNDTRMMDFNELIPNRAAGYSWENGKLLNAVRISPEVEMASGGVMSTIADMAKWDAALNRETLLQASSLKEMWTPATLNNDNPAPYGLGFGLTPYKGRARVGHTGGGPGFSTGMSRFVDDKVTVIVLANMNQPKLNVGEMVNEIASFYIGNR